MTSHDVVARCRKALDERRIGHAGTLDPMATGVLVLGIGRGTRLLRFLETYEKEYVAEVTFGARTTTQDAEGTTLDETDASSVDAARAEAGLAAFRGEIKQVPPMVSAIKVDGERLYRKARRGEEVERAPRAVTVREAVLTGFTPGARARAEIRVVCSKGTYIRTLAADWGDALGVGAHLSSLRRTRVGSFSVEVAVALDEVAPAVVRPMGEAVDGYARRVIDADDVRALLHGKPLPAAGISGPYAAWGPDGLVAMLEDQVEEARSLCVLTQG